MTQSENLLAIPLHDGVPPPHPESLGGHFECGRGLLPLVFGAIDLADRVPDQGDVEMMLFRNLLGGQGLLDVVLQDGPGLHKGEGSPGQSDWDATRPKGAFQDRLAGCVPRRGSRNVPSRKP